MNSDYLLNPNNSLDSDLIGIKAENLIPYKIYTPDFIILTTNFYEEWALNRDVMSIRNDVISDIAKYFQRNNIDKIILRSSCTNEKIKDRGRYLSKFCKPTVPEIKKIINEIYIDFQANKACEKSSIAILIQVYIEPKVLAHLSNERRVNQSNMSWFLEESGPQNSPTKTTDFKVEAVQTTYDQSLSICHNYNSWLKNLKNFAAFFSGFKNRFHFELLWDGSSFYVLQIDIESEYTINGKTPGSSWKPKKDSFKKDFGKELEVFETVSTASGKWNKIECVKTFEKCNLNYWPIFILENGPILSDLASGNVDLTLITDLKKLLISPIVIRTETVDKAFLSPRTETIFSVDEAVKFLKATAKGFIEKGFKNNQFAFLVHHFIVSSAGALSLNIPNNDITRIDSTWGIVEGLYYHSHDSFEFNKGANKVKRKIRCKSHYVDIESDLKWGLKESGKNYDWRPSLTDEQVKTIAIYTQAISKELNSTVNVMFFINDKKYYPEIIPWFYTTQELSETGTIHDNTILSVKKRFTIKSKTDFDRLKKEYTPEKQISIYIELSFELCRDKVIEEIADFAAANKITVDLMGSMLSHPYYVFNSRGASVRCIDPFMSDYDAKKFYKLVRDKIPALIEDNNEKVLSKKVAPKELLRLLKNKIVEEANELHWSKNDEDNIEEMSDVLEVLRGICRIYGMELSQLEAIANEKRDRRGGFEEGIVLVATKEQSAIKLTKESNELFNETDNQINVKLDQRVQFFHKGDINNLKSLTEVDKIHLPYVNNMASISNTLRYFLKDEKYNSIAIEYDPKYIILTLEVLEDDLRDPSQLGLF